jgi:DNA-binding response OmpR family regulator
MQQTILIIEDDPDTRLALATRIRSEGFEVTLATDGAQGVALAQEDRPDLIILDLGLPAGDGMQVLQRLRRMAPLRAVPVVVFSGRDPALHRDAALAAGAAAYLVKPAHERTLITTIRRHLAGGEASREAPAKPGVLVVEDDADTAHGLTVRLQAGGFTVRSASDTPGALHEATQERPDVILLDLGLPAGDGFVFLERMKTQPELASIPVVILSARDPRINRQRALERGACEFLQKPADPKVLVDTLRRAAGVG